MPEYLCRTITQSGAQKEIRIEAASASEAKLAVQNRGEIPLRVKEASSTAAKPAARAGGRRTSPDEVASAVRQMSILIRAGVPLTEGLTSLCEQAKSQALRDCLEQVMTDVSHGMALSEAFARHPGIFPDLAVEMARVAEAGGNLAESLAKLAEHMESAADIRRKVKSAMSYPLVVVCISVITVILLVTFILPRFMKLFDSMGAKVPWTTAALMSLSHSMISQWYFYLAGTAFIIYAAKRFVRSPAGRQKIDHMALKIPVVGGIVHKIVIGRVVSSLATLLSSGVPMIQALQISAAAANNLVVRDALLLSRSQVVEGAATSQALKASGVFPPLVVQMVASGEKTGELPSMLDHVSAMYKQETEAKVKSLTSVIEPILIVLLGVVVGFIAISVILPIYSLIGSVK